MTHLHQGWNHSTDLIMKNKFIGILKFFRLKNGMFRYIGATVSIEFEYKSEIQIQNCSVIQTRLQLLCYRHNDSLETDQHSIP